MSWINFQRISWSRRKAPMFCNQTFPEKYPFQTLGRLMNSHFIGDKLFILTNRDSMCWVNDQWIKNHIKIHLCEGPVKGVHCISLRYKSTLLLSFTCTSTLYNILILTILHVCKGWVFSVLTAIVPKNSQYHFFFSNVSSLHINCTYFMPTLFTFVHWRAVINYDIICGLWILHLRQGLGDRILAGLPL